MWFAAQLGDQGIGQIAGVVNRVHPAFGDGTSADASAKAADAAAADDAGGATLWSNLAELRAIREGEFEELAAFTDIFGDRPCVEVPQLAADVHDRAGLAHVGRHLYGHSAEA